MIVPAGNPAEADVCCHVLTPDDLVIHCACGLVRWAADPCPVCDRGESPGPEPPGSRGRERVERTG